MNTCFFDQVFYDQEDHDAGEFAAAFIEKYDVFVSFLWVVVYPDLFNIDHQVLDGAAPDRDKSFFIAFTDNADKTNIGI